ncbi:MAG: LysM peptidoglycan-binding domain-containing protein [Chloroflexota bacterium]|nr:MAG: LysM peptidoglycan-binding domain-containing protein [Chloroflexota bacterium]
MRQTLLLCALCLAMLLLAACGQLDIAILDETPDAGATVIGAMTGDDAPRPSPEPTSTRAVQDKETPRPTERPTAAPTATVMPEPSEQDEAQDAGQTEDSAVDGKIIFVAQPPPVATCVVWTDWPLYSVKRGDTLSGIARQTGATVEQLLLANCLKDPDRIYAGQGIRVPTLPVDPPTPTPTTEPERWLRYDDALYKVSFDYPATWRDVSHGLMTKLLGQDGFIWLAGIGAPADLDTVAANEAYHKLLPYGSAPVIETLTLSDGRQARLILPSADQPSSMEHQAMIVTPYAEPIFIGQNSFNYLMLAADADHIRRIAGSLSLPPPTLDIGIDDFTVTAEDVSSDAKRLTFRWQAHGANRGVISSGTGQRVAPWWPVESAGELIVDVGGTLVADPVMTLHVVNDVSGQEAFATAVVSWPCDHDYFFQPGPRRCPHGAAIVADGAYQPFERGFMIWLPRPDLPQPSIYVFADSGQFFVFADTWSAGDSANALEQSPPEGLFKPVRGFGKVWREQPSVRESLGWATVKEVLYSVKFQAEASETSPSIAYLTRPGGDILWLLDSDWHPYIPGQDPADSGSAPG